MTEPAELLLALTTEADLPRAKKLASALLERRLLACVSLMPIHSFFRWDDQLQIAEEVQLLMKTSPERVKQLRDAVLALHSYDTPEWLCWPATASPAYGKWALGELSSDAPPPAPEGTPANGRQAE